jgi:hypothetical protein
MRVMRKSCWMEQRTDDNVCMGIDGIVPNVRITHQVYMYLYGFMMPF